MPKVLRKKCSWCSSFKDLLSFDIDRSKKNGRKSYCKECRREYSRAYELKRYDKDKNYFKHISNKYGLTREAYRVLYDSQDGCCAVCEAPETLSARRFHVDHDHSTGIVRGLLCHYCNVGIGQFEDDPKLLAAAIDYLDRSDVMDGGAVRQAQR
jgi:hypothetical protein